MRPPRGSLPSTMALLRFFAAPRLSSPRFVSEHSLRPGPSSRDRSSYTASFPMRPAGRSPSRLRRVTPFQSFAPRPDRSRFPGPCSLEVPRDVRSNRASRAPFRGLIPGAESDEVLEGPPVALLGFASRVFPSTALAHGFSPGPSSYALSSPLPSEDGGRRPGVLRYGGVGWPFPAADPSGLHGLSAARVHPTSVSR
jgi:hypothetical protein